MEPDHKHQWFYHRSGLWTSGHPGAHHPTPVSPHGYRYPPAIDKCQSPHNQRSVRVNLPYASDSQKDGILHSGWLSCYAQRKTVRPNDKIPCLFGHPSSSLLLPLCCPRYHRLFAAHSFRTLGRQPHFQIPKYPYDDRRKRPMLKKVGSMPWNQCRHSVYEISHRSARQYPVVCILYRL